jgi:ribosomal protein L11
MSDGLCKCGCGQKTTISKWGEKRSGYKKGQSKDYINGHAQKLPYSFVLEDRGYSSPCWIWKRHISRRTGYGLLGNSETKILGGSRRAHRYFYNLLIGPVPTKLQLHHLCHVKCCVNPNHLEPLTSSQHMRKSPQAKLSLEQIDEIVELRKNKAQLNDIATRYNIHPVYVQMLCRKAEVWVYSRLTETQVQEILELRRNKTKMKDIAALYGINPGSVGALCCKAGVWVNKRPVRK